MCTLLINLTRFGDLLQSQAVFSGLKERNLPADGQGTALACLDNFKGAAELLRSVDYIFPLPAASLLALTASSSSASPDNQAVGNGWIRAVGELYAWVEEVKAKFAPTEVLNLTPTLASRLLASVFSQGQTVGFGLDEEGFGVYSTPWSAFLEAVSLCRGSSPFNLVDLFYRAADLPAGPKNSKLKTPAAAAKKTARERLLAGSNPESKTGFLGLQLGASEERRSWPAEYFASLAKETFYKFGLVPVLFGTKSEAPLGDTFLEVLSQEAPQAAAAAVNLIGQTNLGELAATLSQLKILVSNDTGTMHLAAGLGVPCVGIFLTTAQPFDTGPYLPGCLLFEADLPCHPCSFGHVCPRERLCRQKILPETILAGLELLLKGRESCFSGRGARVWESFFDNRGYMDLRSLSGHENDERTLWIRLQREAYRQFLDEPEIHLTSLPALTLSDPLGRQIFAALGRVEGQAKVLAEQGALLLRGAPQAIGKKFMLTWERLRNSLNSEESLLVLGRLWSVLSQEVGRDLGIFLTFLERFRILIAELRSSLEQGKGVSS